MLTRKAPRFKTEQPVSARWTNGGLHQVSGQARDVSTAGLFFYSGFAPDDGSPIEVILTLPAEVTGSDAKTVLCRGRVARVETVEEQTSERTKYGVAVEMDSYEVIGES
jgi:hypothetical protein